MSGESGRSSFSEREEKGMVEWRLRIVYKESMYLILEEYF